MWIAGACLTGAAAIGVLHAVPAGSGAASASRIVDRTVVCQMPGEGFPDSTRFMTVSVSARHVRSGFPPFVDVSNGPSFESRAFVRTGPGGRDRTGAVGLSRTECTKTKLFVRLATDGLGGGSTAQFADSYECDVPATVLIRVRANFKRPTGFVRDPRSPSAIVARGPIATGYLAVAALRGRKPIAFASVNDATGKARLFVAPSRCVPT